MSKKARAQLESLEAVARKFGAAYGESKRNLLTGLEGARLSSADEVRRLHEVLCFLRALPDDAHVLACVERMLSAFHARPDLCRHRAALRDTGIQGTDVHFTFYASMARWLANNWGAELSIEWSEVTNREHLKDRVYQLVLDAETPALDHADLSARGWIERLKGPEETDATFLIRSVAGLPWDATIRDVLFDELELPLIFRTGPGAPSRTSAHFGGGTAVFQTEEWRKPRPDMRVAARRAPVSIRSVSRRAGQELVDLAYGAMMTRERHLDAFAGGDANDVRMVDCGGGLEFAVIGSKPEWRMMLESVYGWLILQNRVPIGYVLSSAFLRSSEIAFNVFDTWRGGDAAHVYGRVLATTRALFGSDTFTIYPYQLGHGNPEGLNSGAWWFYQKLGFRPRDPDVDKLMQAELKRMGHPGGHRSSIATLKKLARSNVYLELGRSRKSVIGTFAFDRVGLAATDFLARRFGSDRRNAERVCATEVADLLGARDWRRFPANERKAWLRWSPLISVLPGLEKWGSRERRSLIQIVRAKGGRRESDYVRLFDAHPKLTAAFLRLAR